MSVAISSLKGSAAQLATLADDASGRPDGRTTEDEVDAYLRKYPVAAGMEGWRELRSIMARAAEDAMPPKRMEELVALTVEYCRTPFRNDELDAWLTARGVTNPRERGMVDRWRWACRWGRDRQEPVDDPAADGVITDEERATLRASVSDKSLSAGFKRVVETGIIEDAEARARAYAALYGEAVRRGAVPGIDPSGPLQPPSAAVAKTLRDGSLFASLAKAQRSAAEQLVARSSESWPRISLFVQQLRVDAAASELVAAWDTPKSPAVTSQDIVRQLFERSDYTRGVLEEPETRAVVASAIVSRLSDAQLTRLDDATAVRLMAALFGGGSDRIDAGLSQQEARSGILLRTSVAGPRAFKVVQGKGPIQTAQLSRLRAALAQRFEITHQDDRYYAPTYTLRAR